MIFAVANLLLIGALFMTMLVLQGAGRRLGERDMRDRRSSEKIDAGPSAGAVYGLLGLLVAFTFAGAGARYEARQQLVVKEANAIGTAWLRLDFLPASAQPHIRALFRQYLDVRLDRSSGEATVAAQTVALQREIWSVASLAARASEDIRPATILLPALNDMFDVTAIRAAARRLHLPIAVLATIALLALLGSMYSGYSMADGPRNWLHTLGFSFAISVAFFVILDFEFPRFGFISIDTADALVDLRRSLN